MGREAKHTQLKDHERSRIQRVTFGNFDTHTVQADFDLTPLPKVKYWAYRANEWFDLDGFLILESSRTRYRTKDKHTGKVIYGYSESNCNVVWDRYVAWAENLEILGWLALESQISGLTDYLIMQCIKRSSTLRLSEKS
jgi:hypothetical protein